MSSRATLKHESKVSLFSPAGNGKLFILVEDGFEYCACCIVCETAKVANSAQVKETSKNSKESSSQNAK